MQSNASYRFVLFVTALTLTLIQTGCLKTRAQLKEESDESAPAKVASPQEVQPQGQYAIDEIKGEITRLQGRLEDVERTQKQTSATGPGAPDAKKVEQRVVDLEQAQANMIEAIKKLQESPAASVDPSELIEKGKTQMGGGNFEGAAETLGAAQRTAKGKKAEEATFLRGECFYTIKEYKKAIVEYSRFPEKFTKSAYMSKALFQIGRSFEALGMKEDAKSFYQELIEKFPKSPEAKKARPKVK
ncbi:tetratricopeptide repeat protein [Bdellovibrionota bacterium FG-1]